MARSKPSSRRVPLRHRDLDALSDAELEMLLFNEGASTRRRAWSLPVAAGLSAVGLLVAAVAFPSTRSLGTAALGALTVNPLVLLAALLAAVAAWRLLSARCGSARACPGAQQKRMTRSKHDRKLMGVCGGLADYFGLDPTLVRMGFIVGLLTTGGPPMGLAYFLMAYVLPRAPSRTKEERLRIIRES